MVLAWFGLAFTGLAAWATIVALSDGLWIPVALFWSFAACAAWDIHHADDDGGGW